MNPNESSNDTQYARREFLAKCGKFAVVTPPMVTLMLSNIDGNFAAAHSGFAPHSRGFRGHQGHGDNGFGNGGGDGVPGRSDHQDNTR